MVRLTIMESIKQQLKELKEKVKKAIIDLTKRDCEVGLGGLQIRQSFSYYEEEVYHIDKIYIDPEKESNCQSFLSRIKLGYTRNWKKPSRIPSMHTG